MALTKVTGQVIKSDTNITSHNINSSGIITAVSFSGPLDTTGGNFTGIITATSATFSGNVTIGGTLTYEDVTNIDSLGIVTARNGLRVTAGGINVTAGVSTFAGTIDANGALDVDGQTDLDVLNVAETATFSSLVDVNNRLDVVGGANVDQVNVTGVSTFAGYINLAQKIIHTGDADTSIEFDTNTIKFETAGGERLRITGDGPHLLLGGTDDVNEITESSANAGIVIGGTGFGNGGLAIINSTTGTGRIYFGDATTNNAARNRGQINYYHNGDYMMFVTAGGERLRITSDGQIGINKSSPKEWHTDYRSLQIHDAGYIAGSADDSFVAIGANNYLDTGGSYDYTNSDFASQLYQVDGNLIFRNAASGTADNAITWLERFKVDATGRIGIGGNGIGSGLGVYLQRSSPTTTNFYEASDGTKKMITGVDSTNDYVKIGSLSNHRVGIVANNGEKLSILSDGKIGINTTVPTRQLEVFDATQGTIAIKSGDAGQSSLWLSDSDSNIGGIYYEHANNALGIRVNDGERLRIDDSGRIGLGIANPGDYFSSYNRVVMGRTNDTGGMTIVSANDSAGYIVFADGTSGNEAYRGRIIYSHGGSPGDFMRFDTDATERLRIEGDGRITTPVSSGKGGIGLVGAFMARPTSTYDTSSGLLKISLGTEEYDANGWFDTSNSRYTPLCKGWYQFNFFIQYQTNLTGESVEVFLYPYKNGSSSGGGPVHGWNSNYGNYAFITFSTMIYMNGSSDYIEMYSNCSRTTDVSANTRMSGFLVHPVA